MKLYWNKKRRVLGTTPGATSSVGNVRVKRYEDVRLELLPVNESGELELYDGDATGLLVVKRKGDYSGGAVLLDLGWTTPTAADAGYVFALLAAGTSLDTELGQRAEAIFGAEIFVTTSEGRLPLPSFDFIVENNYWREDPAPPDPESPYPLPGELITRNVPNGLVRISASGLEIKDSVTHVWRRVSFVDGELTFTTL